MKISKVILMLILLLFLASCGPAMLVPVSTPTALPTATRPVQVKSWPGLHDGWTKFSASSYIDKVAYDPAGYLWATNSDDDIFRWNIESHDINQFNLSNELQGTISSLTFYDGELWVSSASGNIGYYSNDKWSFQKISSKALYYFSITGDRLWVSGSEGLFYLSSEGWKLFDLPSQVDKELTINKVVKSADGTFWFIQANEIASLKNGGQWQKYENLRGVVNILAEPGGLIWFIFPNLVVSLDREKWSSLVLPGNYFEYEVYLSRLSPEGNLWLLTNQGAFVVKNGRAVTAPSPIPPEMPDTIPAELTSAGAIFRSRDGISLYDYKTIRNYEIPYNSVFNQIIRNQVIGFSPDGSLWTWNDREGLVRFDGLTTSHPFQYDRLLPNTKMIPKARIAQDGSIWSIWPGYCCLYQYSLQRSNPYRAFSSNENNSFFPFAFDIPLPMVDFAFSPDGSIWLGFDSGQIAKFSPSEPSVQPASRSTEVPTLKLDEIKIGGAVESYNIRPARIEIDPKGNVWIIALNAGLYEYVGENWKYFGMNQVLLDPTAFAISPDSDIWIGSANHLYKFDGKRWVDYKHDKINPSSMIVAPDGAVWFADKTSLGVYRFDGRTWRQFTWEDGLPYGLISKILVAPDGALWFFTQYSGWARYKP